MTRGLSAISASILAAVVLASSAAHRSAADAQGLQVKTAGGVGFMLPASFHEVPAEDEEDARVRLFREGTDDSLEVTIGQGDVATIPRLSTLPGASGPLPREHAKRLGATLVESIEQAFDQPDVRHDIEPLEFDKERYAYEVQVTADLASVGWSMLREDDSSTNWQQVRQTGARPEVVKCLIEHLLAGAQAATPARLVKNYSIAQSNCGVSLDQVAYYAEAHPGPRIFARFTLVTRAIVFLTQRGSTIVRVSGVASRADDMKTLSALIWSNAVVEPEVRIAYSMWNRLRDSFSILPAPVPDEPAAEYQARLKKRIKGFFGMIVTVFVTTFGAAALLSKLLAHAGVATPARVVLAVVGIVTLFGFKCVEHGVLESNWLPTLTVHFLTGLIAYVPLTNAARKTIRGRRPS